MFELTQWEMKLTEESADKLSETREDVVAKLVTLPEHRLEEIPLFLVGSNGDVLGDELVVHVLSQRARDDALGQAAIVHGDSVSGASDALGLVIGSGVGSVRVFGSGDCGHAEVNVDAVVRTVGK